MVEPEDEDTSSNRAKTQQLRSHPLTLPLSHSLTLSPSTLLSMTSVLLAYNTHNFCRRCSSCNTDITEDLYSRHKVRCVYEEFMREKAKKEALRRAIKKNQ